MPAPTKLNPFALKAMLKNRDEDVATLRVCIRYLLPLAQESIGAYPPEHVPKLEDAMKEIRRVLRDTRKPKIKTKPKK